MGRDASLLDRFLERAYRYPGARVKFVQVQAAFLAYLPPFMHRQWPRRRILNELRELFPVGADSSGTLVVGDLSFIPPPAFQVVDGRLRQK